MLGCLLAASCLALNAALVGGRAVGGDLLLARRRLRQGPQVGQNDEATIDLLEDEAEEALPEEEPGQGRSAVAEHEAVTEAEPRDDAAAEPAGAAPAAAAFLPPSGVVVPSTASEDTGGSSAEGAAGSGSEGAGASAEGGSAQEVAAGDDDDIDAEFEKWAQHRRDGGKPGPPGAGSIPGARDGKTPGAPRHKEEAAPRKVGADDLDEEMHLESRHHEVTAEEEFLQNAAKKASDGRDRALAEAAHNKEMEADALQRKKAAEQMIKEAEQKRQHALKIAAETAHAEKLRGEKAAAEAIEHTAAYRRQVKKGKQEHEELARARAAKQRFADEYHQMEGDLERLREQADAQKAVRASAAAEAAEERKLVDQVGSVLGEAQRMDALKEAAREMTEARKRLEGEFRRRAPMELDDHDFEGGILSESDLEFEVPALRRTASADEPDGEGG